MPTTITVGPVTRIEGHLDITVTIDTAGGVQQVVDAQSSGTMFRGFEAILQGRDPRDASQITQRICGVCPTSHAMAASLVIEDACGFTPPENGRLLRNIILGADFVMSHILHFYHLAAPDYIDTTGLVDMSPWMPRIVAPDMVAGATAQALVGHYVQALAIRRQAHQLGAIFSGRLPCSATMVAGGCAETVTAGKVSQANALLSTIRNFIDTVMLPDVQAVGSVFSNYYNIGRGSGNLLAFGVFDLDASGASKLLARGRYTGGSLGTVNTTEIQEYVKYSKFSSASGLNPSSGATTPDPTKTGAYSWLKAPRYANATHEVGALARMWVNGDYRRGISVIDRIVARALECQKIANAMSSWLAQLVPGQAAYAPPAIPVSATGIGLTEAPRGALGHWLTISQQKIGSYQVISPTTWNASPRDDAGRFGAIEQALVGTPVANPAEPIELLRVVHSFDPCLDCAMHAVTPEGQVQRIRIAVGL